MQRFLVSLLFTVVERLGLSMMMMTTTTLNYSRTAMQVRPLLDRAKPAEHSQEKAPPALLHAWSQPPLSYWHGSMAETHRAAFVTHTLSTVAWLLEAPQNFWFGPRPCVQTYRPSLLFIHSSIFT